MKPALAHLERVNLREAWKHEACDFTPWLAQDENLQMLADALGLPELELVATEHPVGDFKVDILCSDAAGEVIIENQLEKTNHTHLGQIITYAAGVGAKKVVWVAESFRPEHVAALEFLNQNTTGDLNFFAVKVELWRIADSPMAPNFNVVVKPNGWSKAERDSTRAAAVARPAKKPVSKFWAALSEHLAEQEPDWTRKSPFNVTYTVASGDRIGVKVEILRPHSPDFVKKFLGYRQALENEVGFELDVQKLPLSRGCCVTIFRPDSDLHNEANWPAYYTWLADTESRLSTVLEARLKDL